MANLVFTPIAITANVLNALSTRDLKAFIKSAPRFAAAVEAGDAASIKVGRDVFVHDPDSDGFIADVVFQVGKTKLDPLAASFTLAAVSKAAAESLELTEDLDLLRLTADSITITAPTGTFDGLSLVGRSMVGDVIRDASLTDADVLNAEISGAGTGVVYIVQNQVANATYDATADTVVALVGTSATPTLANFVG